MYRIGVFSDSHGNREALVRALAHANANFGDIDHYIHCGDGADDLVDCLSEREVNWTAVRGNCDFGGVYAPEKQLNLAERSIFISHGHLYDVKFSVSKLFYRALEIEAQLVLFGHTHVAEIIENEGVILFNPGSVARPKGCQKPSYGIVEIEHKILNCSIINFE